MQTQGVVISVNLNTKVKKQSGGTYDAWELVYKSTEGEIKNFQKPVQGLKFVKGLKEALESLAQGDEFTATLEKNAGGFWDVKSIVKGLVVEAAAPQASPARQAQTTNNYQGRDYESKEERTAKQEYIIRQSSVSSAIAMLSVGAKSAPKVDEVLAVAGEIVAFVYGKSAAPEVTDMEDDDVPY